MPKRILIFSLAYFPKFVGGAEIAIKEITDRLPADEFEFHMVTLRFDSTLPKVERVGNVLVHRIGYALKEPHVHQLRQFPLHFMKFFFQFLAAWKASQLQRKYHYDAIWAMMAHSCGIPAALFKTFHPEIPYILTLQEGDPIARIKRMMSPVYPLFKRAFERADVIQAISTFLAKWGAEMGFRGEVQIIPNGVDTGRFSRSYAQADLDRLRREIGKKEGDVLIVTASRLVIKNGISDVLEAMVLLPENFHFLILGIGPLEETLRRRVAELGLHERVRFLGQIDHLLLPLYLQISDVFIRPSLSEGMGNSFLEAMAAGVPVVATQVGGIADFLFDPERDPQKSATGLAVDPHDPPAIALQIRKLIENRMLRDGIVENARRIVLKDYDWERVARDMRDQVFATIKS